jgi:MYXO-CTERM domain-containing protein
MGWAAHPGDRSFALGRYNSNNLDITLENNFLVGATEFTNPWQSVTMTGNTFYGTVSGSVAATDYPSNTYLSAPPARTTAFVRKNPYDTNRAHIVVYNWNLLDTVDVDVGTVLVPGTPYEVRNAQNYFGAPVASGTYSGGAIALPMSAGSNPAAPIGPGLLEPAENTGKQFNVFVLLANGAGLGDGGVVATDAAVGSTAPAASDGGGCGCQVTGAGSAPASAVSLLALLALRKRRLP